MDATTAKPADPGTKSGKSPEALRTISEVAEELHLPPHVLRFWETQFSRIKPMKRAGGRRLYPRGSGIVPNVFASTSALVDVQRARATLTRTQWCRHAPELVYLRIGGRHLFSLGARDDRQHTRRCRRRGQGHRSLGRGIAAGWRQRQRNCRRSPGAVCHSLAAGGVHRRPDQPGISGLHLGPAGSERLSVAASRPHGPGPNTLSMMARSARMMPVEKSLTPVCTAVCRTKRRQSRSARG